ncbi:BLOC-1-related complex subunit 5-like [Tigriopus californicus]|uniref:BLOC-1-related complex subunit 5-like n=1 Tax=Tigriopus californicus TaxID=6832 RepID=UPI0027DA8288|nr:BLOC-1-related complex subunit 5-like [Tigriopus californicus]
MGSDQSTARSRTSPSSGHAPASFATTSSIDPLYSLCRDGALSPDRQDSICSETSEATAEVPYVSYTAKKPIGDSPKKAAKSKISATKFRLNVSKTKRILNSNLSQSAHNTLVTVNHGIVDPEAWQSVKDDPELSRLNEIPSFLPIMRATLSANGVKDPDILERLDYRGLLSMALRLEGHMRANAAAVTTDQAEISQSLRAVDQQILTLTQMMTDRQKQYVKTVEKLNRLPEMSKSLNKCHILLNENIEQMEILNNMLPPDIRLEPFVWTTSS